MLKQLMMNHKVAGIILMAGIVSLLLQFFLACAMSGYVKASANMKTTRKKLLLNLKNQFETIYGMDYQVHNISVYVEKYLLKLRVLGFSLSFWEKLPVATAGVVTLLAAGDWWYGGFRQGRMEGRMSLLTAYGLVMVCLFVFYHIFGIKSKKEQVQIQLVDYLENYLTNRLIRKKEGSQMRQQAENVEVISAGELCTELFRENRKREESKKQSLSATVEEDIERLKHLLKDMETERETTMAYLAATGPEVERSREDQSAFVGIREVETEELPANQAEVELLEEFVQSFLEE